MTTNYSLRDKAITIFHEDGRFINEVLLGNEYQKVMSDLVVMDIGANIGAFSYWIYDWVKILYAIEPSKDCVNLMEQTKAHNCLDKLNIYCLGISGTGGDREFFCDSNPNYGGWHMDLNPFTSTEHTMIRTKTIAGFLNDEKIEYIDLLKMDVEGAELEILSSDGFRTATSKIHSVVGEYHTSSPKELLDSMGYRTTVDGRHFMARHI